MYLKKKVLQNGRDDVYFEKNEKLIFFKYFGHVDSQQKLITLSKLGEGGNQGSA